MKINLTNQSNGDAFPEVHALFTLQLNTKSNDSKIIAIPFTILFWEPTESLIMTTMMMMMSLFIRYSTYQTLHMTLAVKLPLTIIHRSGGKYPPLFTDTEVNNCFSIYHTSWITSGPKSNIICDNIPTKAILFFVGCSEVNSTWLITSELANQRARKVLFTCVVYTK